MKNIAIILLLTALTGFSCNSNFFGKKTPHEQYADKLDDTGIEDTPEGRLWLAASEKALKYPQNISLPYRQQGYFHPDKPRSLGLEFKAQSGERISFNLTRKTKQAFVMYADLFKQDGGGNSHLYSADTSGSEFSFDIAETGTYVLRLQPQLFHSGEYNLSISIGPSLSFPVSGNKARVESYWGDSRDGGKRRHEGIDIFAPKLTPAIAAADGYITGVKEGGLGGKTVWLKPNDKNVFLYYAHLDKQLVSEGQFVNKGQVVGLVGNTGNAKHTPAHLHFGVYTYNGPIDALPFVNRETKSAPSLPSKNLREYVKLTKSQKTREGHPVKVNTLIVPLAATSKGYIGELPDGNLIQVPFSSAKAANQPVKTVDALATMTVGESGKS